MHVGVVAAGGTCGRGWARSLPPSNPTKGWGSLCGARVSNCINVSSVTAVVVGRM